METKMIIKSIVTKEIIVDDLISDNIKLLNEKGYVTKYCCSGHPSDLFIYEENDYNPELSLYHMGSYVAFDDDSAKDIEKLDYSLGHWIYENEYKSLYGYVFKKELDSIGPEKCIMMLMDELKDIINKLPNRNIMNNKIVVQCEPNINEFDNLIEACEKGRKIYRKKYANEPIIQPFEDVKLINLFNKIRNYAILHDKDTKFQSKNDEFVIESFLVIANGRLLKLSRYKDQYCRFNLVKCDNIEYSSIIDMNDII